MALNLTVKVAGVTFESRQDIIKRLRGDEACRIVPEPSNPYDPNALAVHVALADGTIAHIGYIPKSLAAEVAPLLDGEAVMVEIREITGGFDLDNGETANVGLQIHVYLAGETDETDDPGYDDMSIGDLEF